MREFNSESISKEKTIQINQYLLINYAINMIKLISTRYWVTSEIFHVILKKGRYFKFFNYSTEHRFFDGGNVKKV